MKVLLDTNAYTALRQGQELVAEQVRNSEEVLLSIVDGLPWVSFPAV